MKVLAEIFKEGQWLEADVVSRHNGSAWNDKQFVDFSKRLVELSISGEDAVVLKHDDVFKLMTRHALSTLSLAEIKAGGKTIDEAMEAMRDEKQIVHN